MQKQQYEKVHFTSMQPDKYPDLEKDFLRDVADNGTWCEYIISENNDIIARTVIWEVNDNSYEIAAVSTDPQYQQQGYATGIVSFCTQKILSEGKTATCTTKADNIPMRKTLEKLGFLLKN